MTAVKHSNTCHKWRGFLPLCPWRKQFQSLFRELSTDFHLITRTGKSTVSESSWKEVLTGLFSTHCRPNPTAVPSFLWGYNYCLLAYAAVWSHHESAAPTLWHTKLTSAVKMETAGSSETLVWIHQTTRTWRHISEGRKCNIHFRQKHVGCSLINGGWILQIRQDTPKHRSIALNNWKGVLKNQGTNQSFFVGLCDNRSASNGNQNGWFTLTHLQMKWRLRMRVVQLGAVIVYHT